MRNGSPVVRTSWPRGLNVPDWSGFNLLEAASIFEDLLDTMMSRRNDFSWADRSAPYGEEINVLRQN